MLEDPFAVKFIPDMGGNEPRYFLIGQTVEQKNFPSSTPMEKGENIAARDTSPEESVFYERNYESHY